MFVRYASQLVKEGVSLLRWVSIIFICLYMGKRALQLEHWARSAIQFYIISIYNEAVGYTYRVFPGKSKSAMNRLFLKVFLVF